MLKDVTITDVAAEGKSLARVNEMVVFIPFGAPGDVADIKIDRKKHSYAEGHIDKLTTPSSIRINPVCEHFEVAADGNICLMSSSFNASKSR